MILMGIMTVLSLLHLFAYTVEGLISAIIYGGIYGYELTVLRSLFFLFKEESERGFTVQYHAAVSAV